MIDFVGSIAEIIIDIQQYFFKKKKAKQRKFEKENGLLKKRMISPYQRVFIIFIGVIFISLVYINFFNPFLAVKRTTKKIVALKGLLEIEKEFSGFYPKELHVIIRKNPLLTHLLKDSWENTFRYKPLAKGNSYELFSLGEDGKPNTEDDIK